MNTLTLSANEILVSGEYPQIGMLIPCDTRNVRTCFEFKEHPNTMIIRPSGDIEFMAASEQNLFLVTIQLDDGQSAPKTIAELVPYVCRIDRITIRPVKTIK